MDQAPIIDQPLHTQNNGRGGGVLRGNNEIFNTNLSALNGLAKRFIKNNLIEFIESFYNMTMLVLTRHHPNPQLEGSATPDLAPLDSYLFQMISNSFHEDPLVKLRIFLKTISSSKPKKFDHRGTEKLVRTLQRIRK